MDVANRLKQAIEDGEVLSIKYNGGSQPGSVRQIAPIQVNGDKLRARCFTTGKAKLFKVDKVELMDHQDAGSYVPPERLVQYETLEDFIAQELEKLHEAGWSSEHEPNSLSIFRHFKNGKRLKTPSLSIEYTEVDYHLVYGVDGEFKKEYFHRERPWSVSSNKGTKTYKHFDKAANQFLSIVKTLPNPKP